MTPAIEAVGAFTSVGATAGTTMGSLLTGTQLLDDLAVRGPDGDPVSGAVTGLGRRNAGVDRLGAMALAALRECALGRPASARRCSCARRSTPQTKRSG